MNATESLRTEYKEIRRSYIAKFPARTAALFDARVTGLVYELLDGEDCDPSEMPGRYVEAAREVLETSK
jgi:hypothetical protein